MFSSTPRRPHLQHAGLIGAVFFILVFPSASHSQTYDVSTPDIPQGSKGSQGSKGRSGGGHGEDGGPGEKGRNADHAGHIDIMLLAEEAPTGVQMSVTGSMKKPKTQGGKTESIANTFPLSQDLKLDAHGGDGGKGGDGGDGGAGGKGSSGSDATRYSEATDGGRGGRGGDSGQPGAGGNAGAGGDTTVRVNERDLDLLMTVSHRNDAGKKGPIGDHGQPGSGGPGGDGGSGYSWTETEYYTDSDGKRQSRTTYHSRSAGSDGPRGSDGSTPAVVVTPGASAPDGKHQYIVTYEDGRETSYASRYNIDVLDFSFRSENQDNIFEPGETVIVDQLKVANIGGMHTPRDQSVRIFINGNEWVLGNEQRLTIPKVLDPGESYEFKEPLTFQIKDISVTKRNPGGGPFRAESDILPLAKLDRVERVFPDRTSKPFVIEFPIKMSPVTGLHSLMAGEGTRLSWTVKNVSSRHFGEDSDLKRAIETQVQLGDTQIESSQVFYRDVDGREFSLDSGHLTKILKLGPGEETTIEATAYISPKAKDYRRLQFRNTLALGKIDDPASTRPIQIEEHNVTTATRYQHSEGSEFLLVTNNRTTNEEVQAWKSLAEQHGRSLEIWDLSYHGHFDASQQFQDRQHILADFQGDTIILANGIFDTGPESRAYPGDFLTRKDLLLAAGKYGVNFYIPGKEIEELGDLLTPVTTDRTKKLVFDARDKFYEAVNALNRKFPSLRFEAAENADINNAWDVKVSFKSVLWGRPKDEKLAEIASSLREEAKELFPEKEHRVNLFFDPALSKAHSDFIAPWSFGSLLIDTRTTPDVVRYQNISDFEAQLAKIRDEFPEFSILPPLQDMTENIWEIDVTLKKDVWVKPSEDHLRALAEKLNRRLEKLFPERSFRLIYDFQPDLLKHVPLLSKTHRYGTIQVRESVPQNFAHLATLPVDSEKLRSSSFILGEENLLGFYKALRPESKIEFLKELAFSGKKLGKNDRQRLQSLLKVILSDLADEQMVARRDPQFLKKSVHQRTPFLAALSNMADDPVLSRGFSSVEATSPEAKTIAQFIADVRYLLDSQVRWYEHLTPIPNNVDSSRAGHALLERFQSAAFSRLGVPDLTSENPAAVSNNENHRAGQALVKDLEAKLKAQQKAARAKRKRRPDPRVLGYSYAHKPIEDLKIVTDLDLQPQGEQRVLSQEEYLDRAMAGLERAEAIDARVNKAIADRCQLLLGDLGERITFNQPGDRYYEGQSIQTPAPVTGTPGSIVRQSDPEVRIWDPKFEAGRVAE